MNQNFKMETKQEVKNKFRFDEDLDLPLSVVLTEFSSKVMTRSRSSKVKYMEESDEDYNPKSKKKSPSRSPTKSPKKEPKTEFPEESKPVVSVKIPKSKRWQCKKCFSLFSSERKLKAHRKANKEGKTNCSYFYNDTEQLYTCVICSAKTGTVEQMKKHVMKEHGERFKCATCGKTFALLFFYAVHLKNKHTHESSFKCPACNFESVVKDDLRNHISILHPKRTKYPCDLCGRVFGYLISYQEHRNEHLGIKPFICEVCNMDFVVLQKLQTHQILCHTVLVEGQLLPFQCHLCKKIFANTETLSKHISDNHLKERDNDKKKHLCDACGKGFATADKLRVHYRIHTGVKPFACRGCEKRFSKKDYLIMHERIHTGEKPYVCNFCGKCFNQSAPLRIHERMHTGERPYVCEICNFGYISRASLNVHAKVCKGGILTSWT